MVAAMPLQNDARPSEKTVTLRDLRRVAFGLSAAIMIVMIAGAINDDSGSSTATVLEETSSKSFAAPVSVAGPTSTGTEDVAYSSTITWTDTDGTDVVLSCVSGCSSWITFTDGGSSADTATIAGTPLDAHVGNNVVTIQGTSGGETNQVSYTIAISQVNDAPTLTATGASGTFTEDGSNLALYSSAAAADSDSQATQTFTTLVLTVTNVADTTEYLVVNSVDCDLTDGNSENAGNVGGSAVTCAVSVSSGTATVTLTHAGMTDAQLQTLVDGFAYKNPDQSPTAGSRAVTITSLPDNGGGSDTATLSIGAAVTVASAADDPVIANSDNTGAVTEAASGTTDSATDTLVVSDADGETVTWSCSGCTDAVDTQTLTGTYGAWVLTEATGAWAYTLNNADTDTDQLDAGDSVTDTLTAVATDSSGASDSITVTVTVSGANDAPSTSTPSTQSGTEDTTFTGYTISDFPFTDVDDGDSALTSITITVVESSGDLEKSTDGSSWTDVSANDVILAAHIQHLRLAPAANSNADVTFTYTVQDGATSSGTAVMTTSFAAANDVPTWSGTAADVTTNEDVAKAITGSVIADVDDTTLDSMTISSTQGGTFTLASVSGLTFASGDGTDDNSMVFGGTVANINTAIATITWTSASNVNTNAVLSLTANDGDGDSATDTVAITVNAVQDAPTSAGDSITVNEDTAYNSWTSSAEWGYSDPDSDSMTKIKIISVPSNGALTETNNACGGDGCAVNDEIVIARLAAGDLIYKGDSNYAGTDSFTFQVHDGTTYSSTATMAITVSQVNDAPTAAADTRVVVEDTQTAFTSNDIADAYSDTESNAMTRILITVVESSGDLECNNANGASNGWADCSANDYVAASTDIRFTPDADSVADATFSFKVYDGTVYSTNAYVFTITITAVNDAPANAGDSATASEDVAYSGWTAATDWGYTDVDGDTMVSITIKSLPSQGTLSETNNACGGDGCAVGDTVILARLAAGDLKYTGGSNYNGADSFTYTLEDAALSSPTGTMSITVSAVNDAPVAGDTSDQTVYEDVAFSFQTTQSTDVDGDTMTITCVETGGDMPAFLSETADSGGQATLGGTPTAAALTLADSDSDNTYAMTCTTSDGAATATDTFIITVTAVNDAPVLSSDGSGDADAGSVVEDAAFSVTLTATDEENADVTFAKNGAGSCPAWITISDGGAGAQTATLAAANTATTDARVGDHTCDLTLSDGSNTILETYTLTITQKNDEPTVTATTSTPTFTEDGSAVSIYSSSAVSDSDAVATQTFTSLVLTVTNVADTTEFVQVKGNNCDLTNGNSETTTISSTNDLTCAVSVNAGTATVTITHAGLTAAQMQTLIDGLKYTNSDQSPTAGNRVISTYGVATLMKVDTDTWFISGTGVS